MGIFDYDPYEVGGVHYRSLETYERARKRAEQSGKRAEDEAANRAWRDAERDARRSEREATDAASRERREAAARERAVRDLGIEGEKTRREELRLERARMQEEAADRRAAEAAGRRASAEERKLALERLGERMAADAEAWSFPAALEALDERFEPDIEAASAALAGPAPKAPPQLPAFAPLPLRDAEAAAGQTHFRGLDRPQCWWPTLLPETAPRSEGDMASERDAVARRSLKARGIGGEYHPLPGRRKAWKEAYEDAFLSAEIPAAVRLPENAAANAATRILMARCTAATVAEIRESVGYAAHQARRQAGAIRFEAGKRLASHEMDKRDHERKAAAYGSSIGPWTDSRDGWAALLGEALAGYADGSAVTPWLASAACWSLEPYVPGIPEVAASFAGGIGILDIVIPQLSSPPGGVRPLPDGHLESTPLPEGRARELATRAARHLVVRVLVEAFRKDPEGRLSALTVNAWSPGVPVGAERRGVGFLSSATAPRDLALAYNGDAEAFLRAAGTPGAGPTTVRDGTLVPEDSPPPVWFR